MAMLACPSTSETTCSGVPCASISEAPERRSSCGCQWPSPARSHNREKECEKLSGSIGVPTSLAKRRGRQPGHITAYDPLTLSLPERPAEHRPHDPDTVRAITRVPFRLPQLVKIGDGQLHEPLTPECGHEVET